MYCVPVRSDLKQNEINLDVPYELQIKKEKRRRIIFKHDLNGGHLRESNCSLESG
jgi:hypothetical protein